MKALISIIVLFSLISFTNDRTEQVCTINGQIANEVRYISGAHVVLLVDGYESVEAITDYRGNFSLQFVPNEVKSKYELKCSANLYDTKTKKLANSTTQDWASGTIILEAKKGNRIPGQTIKWDFEAWDRRSAVR